MPEATIIPELLSGSRKRVQTMLESEELPVKPAPPNAYLDALRKKNEGARPSPQNWTDAPDA